MAFKAREGERYTIRRKILTMFGAKFHVYGSSGEVVAFCHQKAFKLREDIRLYTDESKSTELFALRTQQIIDFSVTFDVVLPGGEKLGSFRRKGMKSSFLRDEWLVFDSDGKEVARLLEKGKYAPLVRRYVDNAAAFMPARYELLRIGDGACLAEYRQHFNWFVYRLGVSPRTEDEHVDDLVVLAGACLIAAIEGRQN